MRKLSDIQIGFVRRDLSKVLDFVPGPTPTGEPDVIRQWCRKVCDVDTSREVAERWTKGVKDLGRRLFAVGMAERVRQHRPATLRDWLVVDLKSCEDLAPAILCVAVDEAEGNEIFRRARLGAQNGQPVPDQEREHAADLLVDGWQITDVLENVLLVDPNTFRRFTAALRALVEQLLLDTQGGAPQKIPSAPKPVVDPVDLRRASEPTAMLNSLISEAELRRRQEDGDLLIAAEGARRLNEHAAHRERLAKAFDHTLEFPNDEQKQSRKPSADGFRRWSKRFIALGTVLRECDEAIANLGLRERLRTVAAKPAPAAVKFACALLLASYEQPEGLATALEQAHGDGQLRQFVLWLPFILDNLWRPYSSENGMRRVAEAPDGTNREEHRQAGEVFGWKSIFPPTETVPDRAGPAAAANLVQGDQPAARPGDSPNDRSPVAAHPFPNGPKARKNKSERRHEIIAKQKANGLSDSEVYQVLKEHHFDLLTYGKSRTCVSLESVMKTYRRWKGSRDNCNRTGTIAIIP